MAERKPGILLRGFSTDIIRIPERMLIPGSNSVRLLEVTFPSLFYRSERSNFPMHDLQGQWGFYLSFINRSILTSTNVEVKTFIDLVMNEFLRVEKVSLSQDSVCTEDHPLLYSPEVLNAINTESLPPYCLKLKIGCPIMLLRNLDLKRGLPNGTRLIVKRITDHITEAIIATGPNSGETVYIPCMKIILEDRSNSPVDFKRCQFLIRLVFAMTINKAQGQTMDFLGLSLTTLVFSHGQLYAAFSRIKKPQVIKMLSA
jgi:ATP-dependent DNA helicase PIF1